MRKIWLGILKWLGWLFFLILIIGLGWLAWQGRPSATYTVWVLLQNTDEVRATGGFVGSYLEVELQGVKISHYQLHDIYEPDGQWPPTLKLAAPVGVKEYLSEGRGWRLPDANWSGDFPTAANVFIEMMAEVGQPAPDLIGTVNLDLMEKIVDDLGGIYLPDYRIEITGDNLADQARQDRTNFFAGSQEKVNFLKYLINQLELKWQEMSLAEQIELSKNVFIRAKKDKSMQWWAPQKKDWLFFLKKMELTGEINLQPRNKKQLWLQSLESNVGINKVNRQVTGQVQIETGLPSQLNNFQKARLTYHWQNLSPTDHYANYQRLLFLPELKVSRIIEPSMPGNWTQQTIQLANGQLLTEVGGLVIVPAGEERQLVIEIDYPATMTELEWEKQSGLEREIIIFKKN